MKKVFVTGINGLLGTNLTLMLLEQGFFVFGLIRDKDKFINFKHINLDLIEGDLSNIKILNHNIANCDIVVHIAANTSQNLLKLKDYYSVNVKGTQNIIDACFKNNIKKLVFIGTANTYGYGSLNDLGNEERLMKYPFTKSLYALSKKQAQDLIDKASEKINITTISPTFMIGAYDTKPSSGKIILTVLDKKLVFHPSGGKNFVDIKNVVFSVIKAFEIKETGKKYIIANENLSYKDFFKKVIEINNQKTLLLKVPNPILYLIGFIGDLLRLVGIRTEISSANIKILTINNFYSNLKAKDELEIEFTSINNSVKDAVNWFINLT